MESETYYAGLFAPPATEERASSPEQDGFALGDLKAWRSIYGESVGGSVAVNQTTTVSIPAIWQAACAISHDCARVPARVYRDQGEGIAEDYDHPASPLLDINGTPDGENDGYTVIRRWLTHALLWPNGYLWIDRRGATPTGLYNLLPDRTSIHRSRRNGRLYVHTEYRDPADESRALPKVIPIDDCLVLAGLSWDDNGGLGAIQVFRQQIQAMLEKRRFESRFFSNNATLGGVLQVPPGTPPEKVEKIEKGFEERHASSDKAFRVAVLRDGVKFHSTMQGLRDFQNVELDEQHARQAARMFNMPPSRLGVRESVSYNSDEAARRNYYDTTLTSWLIPMAAQFNLKLLTPSERRRRSRWIKHRVQSWLWADAKTVGEIGVSMVTAGIYTRDEVRAWFEDNPLPDGHGKQPLIPLNMQAAGDPPPAPTRAKRKR